MKNLAQYFTDPLVIRAFERADRRRGPESLTITAPKPVTPSPAEAAYETA